MNLKIARLVLNAKFKIVVFTQCSRQWLLCDKQNIVHLVVYIYMLTSNEEISKIEKTPSKTSTGFSSPWWTSQSLTKASSFPINLSIVRKLKCVKCPGVAPGYPNAHARGAVILRMPNPWDWQHEQMPCGWPGKMGTAGIDWCITPLAPIYPNLIMDYSSCWLRLPSL